MYRGAPEAVTMNCMRCEGTSEMSIVGVLILRSVNGVSGGVLNGREERGGFLVVGGVCKFFFYFCLGLVLYKLLRDVNANIDVIMYRRE